MTDIKIYTKDLLVWNSKGKNWAHGKIEESFFSLKKEISLMTSRIVNQLLTTDVFLKSK